MKVLIYTTVFPYPLNEGGKAAQFSFIEYLVKEHDVLLVCEEDKVPGIHAEGLAQLLPNLRFHYLKINQPIKNQSPIFSLWTFAKKIEWRIRKSIKQLNTEKHLFFSRLQSFTFPQLKKHELPDQFNRLLKAENPDIVQIDFIENADLGICIPKNIPSFLVVHELRSSTASQSAELLGASKFYSEYLQQFIWNVETAFFRNFSSIITFSENDKNLITSFDAAIPVKAVPFAVLDKHIQIPGKIDFIKHLVFIGPEHHSANYDAIEWYVTEIEPLIMKKNNIQLIVIGNWSEKTIKKFQKNSNMIFTGYIEDLKNIFSASAMIVPLRIGSGIRTKILDAFAFGIPVISTSLGCEGINATDQKDIIIANSAQDFCNGVIKLIEDSNFVSQLTNNAHQLVTSNFSQSKIYSQRIQEYKKLIITKPKTFRTI